VLPVDRSLYGLPLLFQLDRFAHAVARKQEMVVKEVLSMSSGNEVIE
jgi:hypothetical protein